MDGGKLKPGWRQEVERLKEKDQSTTRDFPSLLPREDEQLSGLGSSDASYIRRFGKRGPLPEVIERVIETTDHFFRVCVQEGLELGMSQEGGYGPIEPP